METEKRLEEYLVSGGRPDRPGTAAPRLYEEYGYVLDAFLSSHDPLSRKARRTPLPLAQVVGEKYFTLLALELKPRLAVAPHERLYIGREQRAKVESILGRMHYQQLSEGAKAELQSTIEEAVNNQEERFVAFFNNSRPITPRMHSIELLPGIGKKFMWQIVDARDKKPFESFKDIRKRTSVSDPAKAVAKRIVKELRGEAKYTLFIRPT